MIFKNNAEFSLRLSHKISMLHLSAPILRDGNLSVRFFLRSDVNYLEMRNKKIVYVD